MIAAAENDIPSAKTMFNADASVPDDEFFMMLGDVVAG